MTHIFGLAVFALGIALLVVGFATGGTTNAQISAWLAVHPAVQSVWLLIAGAASVLTGLVLAFLATRKT